MMMSKWLEFSEPSPSKSGKTKMWEVYSSKDGDSGVWLGDIRWTGRWRRYAFYPGSDMMFEHGCLRDLADFCEQQTKVHRQKRRRG